MYATLLTLHNLVRWVFLIVFLITLYRSWRGWKRRREFLPIDNTLRSLTVTLVHIQMVIGVYLYFKSPFVDFFYKNFSAAVKDRTTRYFGMEHIFMMILAVIFITIGGSKARRRHKPGEKFKAMAVWFTIALVILLVSVPWPFSPLTARPWFRWF